MREQSIFELKSLYRESMRVRALTFGDGADTVAIVGSTRGNEVQQLYVCSQIIRAMTRQEAAGRIAPGRSVMVVPTINSYSLNIDKRFWPTDNTDINRMFPGYGLGETTQRIASGVFERIKSFEYGIQLASFYIPGDFTPHVRIMKTGYESPEKARLFGMPYVLVRQPRPYDTATLNYNWQIWGTCAFSLYTSTADRIDEVSARFAVEAVLNFLRAAGVLDGEASIGPSRIIPYEELILVRSARAGIFRRLAALDQDVRKGEALAQILDPYTGEAVETAVAPADARLFFAHNKPLAYASSVLFKLIPRGFL